MKKITLGKTGLQVTSLCFGGGPLGSMPAAFGHEVSSAQAIETVSTIFESPVNFLDTANNYGQSEIRIGESLKRRDGLPEGFIIATKADRDPDTNEFSAERIRFSVEESIRRLGLSYLPLVYLHDPEYHPKYALDPQLAIAEILEEGGPVAELEKLKREGVIGNIGISGGPIDMLMQFVETGRFDVVITHNRWNLLYQLADQLLNIATKRGMGIVNAAVFASGILADGDESLRLAYKSPTEEMLTRVKSIKEVCKKYDVPIGAVALQFSLRDPRIHATVVGVASTPST